MACFLPLRKGASGDPVRPFDSVVTRHPVVGRHDHSPAHPQRGYRLRPGAAFGSARSTGTYTAANGVAGLFWHMIGPVVAGQARTQATAGASSEGGYVNRPEGTSAAGGGGGAWG